MSWSSCKSKSNIMTRHAFMINGMNEQCQVVAQNLRTEILMGKK